MTLAITGLTCVRVTVWHEASSPPWRRCWHRPVCCPRPWTCSDPGASAWCRTHSGPGSHPGSSSPLADSWCCFSSSDSQSADNTFTHKRVINDISKGLRFPTHILSSEREWVKIIWSWVSQGVNTLIEAVVKFFPSWRLLLHCWQVSLSTGRRTIVLITMLGTCYSISIHHLHLKPHDKKIKKRFWYLISTTQYKGWMT